MTELIDRRNEPFLEWFGVNIVEQLDFDKDMVRNEDGEHEIHVKMEVNGKQVSFRKIINEISNQLDEMVRKEAQDLLHSKTGDFLDLIHELSEKVNDKL